MLVPGSLLSICLLSLFSHFSLLSRAGTWDSFKPNNIQFLCQVLTFLLKEEQKVLATVTIVQKVLEAACEIFWTHDQNKCSECIFPQVGELQRESQQQRRRHNTKEIQVDSIKHKTFSRAEVQVLLSVSTNKKRNWDGLWGRVTTSLQDHNVDFILFSHT